MEVAKANFDRMKPAFDSGAITTLEFEPARQQLVAAKANRMTAENAVDQIELSLSSVKENILIIGARFDDENGRLTSELEIAAAKQTEREAALAAANDQIANLNVKAPRDGTVAAVYRQVGELLKVADVGLSFEKDSPSSSIEKKSVQNKPADTSQQNDVNSEEIVAEKVAAGL